MNQTMPLPRRAELVLYPMHRKGSRSLKAEIVRNFKPQVIQPKSMWQHTKNNLHNNHV
jgi:hypothetical protein